MDRLQLNRPAMPFALIATATMLSGCPSPKAETVRQPSPSPTVAPVTNVTIPVRAVVNRGEEHEIDRYLSWLSAREEARRQDNTEDLKDLDTAMSDFGPTKQSDDPNARATTGYAEFTGDYQILITKFSAKTPPPACAPLAAAYSAALHANITLFDRSQDVIATEARIRALPPDEAQSPENQRQLAANADYLQNGVKVDQAKIASSFARASAELKKLRTSFPGLQTPEFTIGD